MSFRSAFPFPAKVNWFPGHMAQARRQMQAQLESVDVVVEVRDARLPWSSANPAIDQVLGSTKPRLVVFNKSDLANPNMQQRVQTRLKRSNADCIFSTATKRKKVHAILEWCNKHSDAQFTKTAGTVVMVAGIPNVGKSSIINEFRRLSPTNKISKGKVRAAVGPTPGVTVRTDTIKVNDKPAVYVVDTPGVMLPNIPTAERGMNLALTGAIKDDVIGVELLADYLLFKLNQMGSKRYVDVLKLKEPIDDIEYVFRQVRKESGGVGKSEDTQRQLAAEYLLQQFRSGSFGQFTLDPVPNPEEELVLP